MKQNTKQLLIEQAYKIQKKVAVSTKNSLYID